MPIDPENVLLSLGEEMSAAMTASSDSFAAMTDTGGLTGNIALGLMRECNIHLITFVKVFKHAREGLRIWKLQHGEDQPSEIQQAHWQVASQSLQLLVRAVEVDKTQEYLELARTISINLGNLAGILIPPIAVLRECSELAEKLVTSNELAHLNFEPFKKTGDLLTRWELYMMRGLLASQYAIISTNSLLEPTHPTCLEVPLEELASAAMFKAKEFVAATVVEARQQLDQNLSVLFPRSGMWPGATVEGVVFANPSD